MTRESMIQLLESHKGKWDVVVIGGGASGLGAALDAATRGYKTLLVEQYDFSKGTSSRSTKLVHGGVRYLQQGDVSLVLEALHERGLLLHNAPHLVRNQSFIIPNYDWWEGPFYSVGMKVYDMMAGKLGLGPSLHLSKEEVLKAIPTLKTNGLCGGVVYHDGQFDDSRLAINLTQSFVENCGVAINYMKCVGLLKSSDGMVSGIRAKDMETGKEFEIQSKVVINATGVWADDILKMEDPKAPKTIVPSQGVHMVVDKEYLQNQDAIMIPHTDDGRVLFAVPWYDKVVVGTTDTPIKNADIEPRALKEEIDFIIQTASHYLDKPIGKKDVRSVFAGLRPLAAPTGDEKATKSISRSHKIIVSVSGLITITGGKWTTYRRMAQDAIDKAAMIAGLEEKPCLTTHLAIHGSVINIDKNDPLHMYGTDSTLIKELIADKPEIGKPLSPKLTYTAAEIIWAVRHEMARTVEDVLARRTRALLLDAQASIDIAPTVASIMAKELNKDTQWAGKQVVDYTRLAKGYLLE
jgi:glycerol-3-phosphate dehydrogenase